MRSSWEVFEPMGVKDPPITLDVPWLHAVVHAYDCALRTSDAPCSCGKEKPVIPHCPKCGVCVAVDENSPSPAFLYMDVPDIPRVVCKACGWEGSPKDLKLKDYPLTKGK